MRLIITFVSILAVTAAFAAPAPFPKPSTRKVKQVTLPSGPVKLEMVETKQGKVVRITAGKVVVEAKSLFYGDGKVASEIKATEKGMWLVHWCGCTGRTEIGGPLTLGKVTLIGGVYTQWPTAIWHLPPNAPTADKLQPGSVYVVTPSIIFRPPPR